MEMNTDDKITYLIPGGESEYSQINVPGSLPSTGIMMSTLWNQSGIIRISGNSSTTYNYYCPTDPSVSKKSVTGCTNTAAGQMIYYFIEKHNFDLQLTLLDSDAYGSDYNSSVVIDIKADGSTPGTVSFSQINSKLADFDINSADDIAALLYACGVVAKANYSYKGTATAWSEDVFYRSGFDCVVHTSLWCETYQKRYWYWGKEDASGNFRISPEGYEVLIENLTSGRVVGTEYSGHALVWDGYDADNDTFHINFGWGNSSDTRWYTREEIYEQQYYGFMYDLFIDAAVTLSVTDGDVYGSNTFIRAWEQAEGTLGENTIIFSDSVAGTDQVWQNYLKITDDIVIENMNIDVMVVDSTTSWGIGFWDSGSNAEVVFNDFSGSLIVNTGENTSAVFYLDNSSCLDFSGGLLYSGKYAVNSSYSDGAEYILSQLTSWKNYGTAINSAVLSGINGYLLYAYGISGNVINVKNSSFAAGSIYVGQATVNIDSSSMLLTDFSGGNFSINVDLNTAATSSPVITILKYAYSFYINTDSFIVEETDDAGGTYTLVAASANTSNINYLKKVNITVKSVSGTSETLNASQGTATTADNRFSLIYRNNSLLLQVKLYGDKNGINFDDTALSPNRLEYSADNFATSLRISVDTPYADTFGLPSGEYQWRVSENGEAWYNGRGVVSDNDNVSQEFTSDNDGNTDIFFASSSGVWDGIFAAGHQGVRNSWKGTGEQVALAGKNKITNVFTGSDDANVLVLTDDINGDALFVENMYTQFGRNSARLSKIREIRAGAGDDVVDMTSQRFSYSGNGVRIYGGSGSDAIWANNGSNTLFGDAGNDRIIGGAGDDYIIGGSGNDSLHGGGGNDIFCFGGNWGSDSVEQLDGGKITLWFESESISWSEALNVYTDGTNTVRIINAAEVVLKYGADASLPDGVFAAAGSENIFENKNSGFLA